MRRGWLQVAVGVGAVALAWVVWLAWPRHRDARPVPPLAQGVPADRGEAASRLISPADEDSQPETTAVAEGATPEASAADALVADARVGRSILVRGRTVDKDGGALAGVGIRLRDEAVTLGRSGEDGSFEIALPRLDVVLDTSDPDRSTLRWRSVTAKNRGELHYLVIAPAVSLTGFIVDVRGTLLEGEVYVAVLERVHTSMPSELTAGSERRMYRYPTDTSGRFVLEQIPFGAQTTIHGVVKGYTMCEQVLVPSAPDHALRLVVKRPGQEQPDHPHLRGLVLDPAGKPAPGATVLFCGVHATSDVVGEFVLGLRALEKIPPEADLIATKRGHLARIEHGYGAFVRQEYPPSPITLVLGGPPLTISGTVVDPAGKPCWASVELLDKTDLDPRPDDSLYAEDEARNEGAYLTPHTELDTGGFVITGLSPRTYTLAVTCGDLRTRNVFEGIQAGSSNLRLQLDPGRRIERIAGRVQGPAGEPLPHVLVSLTFSADETGTQVTFHETDSEGRFEVSDIPREQAYLFFTHRGSILPLYVPVETIRTPLDFVVRPQLEPRDQ